MRAIKIDAKNRSVEEIQIPDGDMASMLAIREHVGALFCAAGRRSNGDVLFVDDNGLLRNGMQDAFMLPQFYPEALVGNGVILGSVGPESADAKSELAEIASAVVFGVLHRRTGRVTEHTGRRSRCTDG